MIHTHQVLDYNMISHKEMLSIKLLMVWEYDKSSFTIFLSNSHLIYYKVLVVIQILDLINIKYRKGR